MQYSEGKPLSDKPKRKRNDRAPRSAFKRRLRTGADLIVAGAITADAITNERILRKASHSTPGDESRARKTVPIVRRHISHIFFVIGL
jgi:hypothetical protein